MAPLITLSCWKYLNRTDDEETPSTTRDGVIPNDVLPRSSAKGGLDLNSLDNAVVKLDDCGIACFLPLESAKDFQLLPRPVIGASYLRVSGRIHTKDLHQV